MYVQIHIERERGKGYTVRIEKLFQKNAQEPYGLLQMLFGILGRSVEDGLEPSQIYDEVNKLLLLLQRIPNNFIEDSSYTFRVNSEIVFSGHVHYIILMTVN